MIRRDFALSALRGLIKPRDLVVAVYQSCFDWLALCPRDLNYVSTGAMGQASSHALGLAIGSPERQVIVLDGDGSLLMNLGSLVTIATVRPQHFLHLVFENGVYEVNGAHPTPGTGHVDFAAMAIAAGYQKAVSFSELETFEAALPALLAADGPVMAVLKIIPGEAYPRDYAYIHSAAARENFRAALNRNDG
ncbi:MAG: thiamine pyrophosphate-binding protein [SAR116 cluster bacterium]|nr:MAG: thiamine pyrophosphate-binding protein [SAR116 cluster bacterium]|tara:strand:+ start:103 stop:678 length:576 start_codon:yes stop_codon:yes gene_type:complete